MKNICFESYRKSKRDKILQAKPKPKQLDSTWYTDNIYSNRSEDFEEDYIPDCIKYGTYQKLRNICEQEEFYDNDKNKVLRGRRLDGEGSDSFSGGLHRSLSCKEFQYPKSQSYCFGESGYEGDLTPRKVTMEKSDNGSTVGTSSILKNRGNVPKSYSFSATSKTTPFDIMDYNLPPRSGKTRREKQETFRKSMSYYCKNSADEKAMLHAHDIQTCYAREHCTNPKCLLNEIYPSYSSSLRSWRLGLPLSGIYGADAGDCSNRNLHASPITTTFDWINDDREERLAAVHYPVICCCATEDYCCHRRQRHHITSRPSSHVHCSQFLHHPAAEEEEHSHCRSFYDNDVDSYIRDERERLLLQDKFLDDDERYLTVSRPNRHYLNSYQRPPQNKSLLEVQPPSRYDEDSCSDSTEMDLEDFNIDLEKYWEELEKPPSPIDIDMQRRNMHSNLKVKNVNVGCYNNGQPIDLHEREQERMLIKKSLLEGMPSPPQADAAASVINNVNDFNFFEHAASPLHRTYHCGQKVYPSVGTLPSYKYNNFYPENIVQTQQPTSGRHHTSASGHSALSLINNIFSIYKPNKYSPNNCHLNVDTKQEPSKKMNVPSTRRPLGAPHSEYMHSMKRPLIVSTEQPHFKIIPEKTGLKISPLYSFDEYGTAKPQARHKLTSTARPLMLPH